MFELLLSTGLRLALTDKKGTDPCRWGHAYCKVLYQLSGRATRSGGQLPGATVAKSGRRYEDTWEWEDLIHKVLNKGQSIWPDLSAAVVRQAEKQISEGGLGG